MKGRRPKPTAIKLAEGNRRKVATAKLTNDVKGKGAPRVPDYLSPDEARIYRDVLAALPAGLLTRADESVIERYAVAYARWREVQRLLCEFDINSAYRKKNLPGRPGAQDGQPDDSGAPDDDRGVSAAIAAVSRYLVLTPQGLVRNPLLAIQDKAERAMHVAGEAIGLSPVARARLASPDNTGDDDPMALLLGMDGAPDGAWQTEPKGKGH